MAPAAAVAKAAKKTEDIASLRYRMAGEMPGEGSVEGRGGDEHEAPGHEHEDDFVQDR
jgi:hypothetical protein